LENVRVPRALLKPLKCRFVGGALIEASLWTSLLIVSTGRQLDFMKLISLTDLSDYLDDDWYYELIFGPQGSFLDHKIRSKRKSQGNLKISELPKIFIVLNLLMVLVIAFYLAFTILLLIGIAAVSAIDDR
jgi:hypothetical protein